MQSRNERHCQLSILVSHDLSPTCAADLDGYRAVLQTLSHMLYSSFQPQSLRIRSTSDSDFDCLIHPIAFLRISPLPSPTRENLSTRQPLPMVVNELYGSRRTKSTASHRGRLACRLLRILLDDDGLQFDGEGQTLSIFLLLLVCIWRWRAGKSLELLAVIIVGDLWWMLVDCGSMERFSCQQRTACAAGFIWT